jgi:hypothetical protein
MERLSALALVSVATLEKKERLLMDTFCVSVDKQTKIDAYDVHIKNGLVALKRAMKDEPSDIKTLLRIKAIRYAQNKKQDNRRMRLSLGIVRIQVQDHSKRTARTNSNCFCRVCSHVHCYGFASRRHVCKECQGGVCKFVDAPRDEQKIQISPLAGDER